MAAKGRNPQATTAGRTLHDQITLSVFLVSLLLLVLFCGIVVYLFERFAFQDVRQEQGHWAVVIANKIGFEEVTPTFVEEGAAQQADPSQRDYSRADLDRVLSGAELEDALTPLRPAMISQVPMGSGIIKHQGCVLDGSEVLWHSSWGAKELCERIAVRPADCRSVKAEAIFSEVCYLQHEDIRQKEGDTQVRAFYEARQDVWRGQVLTVRVLTEQTAYREMVSSVWTAGLVAALGAAALIMVGIHLVLIAQLEPLRRFREDVRNLWAGNVDEINASGRPRELSLLAKVLEGFVSYQRHLRLNILHQSSQLARSMQHHTKNIAEYADAPRKKESLTAEEHEYLLAMYKETESAVNSYVERISTVAGKGISLQSSSNPVPVDVALIASSLGKAARNHQDYLGKYLDIQVPKKARVLCESLPEAHLKEIVHELLRNAGKYLKSKARICVERVDDMIRITVEDDGPGFPENDRERLCEWGYRGEQAKPEGSGIGLHSVHWGANLGKGRVELGDSQDLKGARVIVELPAVDRREAAHEHK
ncbi:MAG: HAMP domain-containing sensor histidine kinase [Rhodospirillales bacterium]|nr:HAMP domain-containing sensor histidine kinase [Rhodospirillales bacterium]